MKTKQARAQNTAGQTTVEPQIELLPETARPVDPCRSSLHFENSGFYPLKDDMQRFFTKLMQKSFLAAYCNINPSV